MISLVNMTPTLAWVYLAAAGCFEVAWAIGLKYSKGFTRPVPTVFTLVTMVMSFVLLAQALKVIPVGTGYAVWTGIGAVGTVLLGIWFFGESVNLGRILCIVMIVGGILGLKFFGGE